MALDQLAMLQFSCACKKSGGSVRVPQSTLPLELNVCHCNTCQHQTGELAGMYAILPSDHTAFEVYGPIICYQSSEKLRRHFCSTCGSNLYFKVEEPDKICLCSGVITSNESALQMGKNIFVSDTKDGGMSSWLPGLPGWEGYTNHSKPVDCSRAMTPLSGPKNVKDTNPVEQQQQLPCHCQCQTLKFKITRPNENSSQPQHIPLPDLLVPYLSSSQKPAGEETQNKDDAKWWLRNHGSKYLAGNCACTSCRENSGFDIQAWAFVPKANLLDTHDDALNLDTMPGLAAYASSEGIHRHFCHKCGATAFWRSDARPDLIDVSVGLLDAEEGARADSWLEWWTERVSFEEEAGNRVVVSNLKEGLKKWGAAQK